MPTNWLATLRWVSTGGLVLAAAAVLGSVVALVVVAFIEGSAWLFAHGVGAAGASVLLVLLLPAVAGAISGWLCDRTMHRSAPGPADVMRAKLGGLRLLSLRDGALAAGASFVGLALGGSVGAYGPVVHLGSTIAAHAARLFGRRAIETGMGCGCAAAIAAVFNAPLAGIIFAHEVILKQHSLRMFAPVATAALAASWVARNGLGRDNFLGFVQMEQITTSDGIVFVFVGIACGLLASGIVHGCLALNAWRRSQPYPAWFLPAVGGLAAGAIAATLDAPEILGGGKSFIDGIADGTAPGNFAILFVAKLLATLACIGLGMAGGLFSPALLIGALFGHTLGEVATYAWPDAELSSMVVYTLVGMFATAAPVIGAPLAGILIAVEFSASYPFALSVAVAIVVASFVSGRLAGGSYYQLQLAAAGVNLRAGPEERILAATSVRARMQQLAPADAQTFVHARRIAITASLWDAVVLAKHEVGEQLLVVDAGGQPVGKLLLEELLLEQSELNRRFRAEEGEL